MKRVLLLGALLSPLANAGVFTTRQVQDYPSDWPRLAGMSAICSEVQGSFIDPNRWRWEREEIPGSIYGSKEGGTREAAWAAFDLPADDVRPEDQRIKSRAFTISIDPNETLKIKYLIDGGEVVSKSFTKDKWACGAEGLVITTHDRTGTVLDKLPNQGRIVQRIALYRFNEFLYVKTVSETKATVLYVIPQSFLNIVWMRFAFMERTK